MKDYRELKTFTINFIAAVEVKRGSVNLEEAKEYLASSTLTVEDVREVAWRFCIALGIRRLVNKGILGAAIVINGGELGKKISLLKPENSETHYNNILNIVATNVALQYPQYKIVAVNGDTVPWHSYEYVVWKEAFGAANQAALNFWTSMN